MREECRTDSDGTPNHGNLPESACADLSVWPSAAKQKKKQKERKKREKDRENISKLKKS